MKVRGLFRVTPAKASPTLVGVSDRILPQSSYDRLRAVCEDILLWDHIDPDAWLEYRPVPDSEYWEEVPQEPRW